MSLALLSFRPFIRPSCHKITQFTLTTVTSRRFSSFRDRKRFYKKTGVVKNTDGYQITLDNKMVKTPHGRALCVPYESLAAAISIEWDSQKDVIKPELMHLTSLSNTVIDDPLGKLRETRVDDILEFLLTDTVCFLSEEPVELLSLQQKEWGELWDWFNNRFKVSLQPSSSLLVDVSPNLRDTMKDYIMAFNDWSLIGFEFAVECAKSLVIASALAEKEISVERAAYLARLEVEFQIAQWGNVEWAHEIDLMDLRSKLAAATLFIHLSSGTLLDDPVLE